MKRNLIYAAALSLALVCLAGCGGEQEQSAPTPASPSDLQVVEPAPAQEGTPTPVEEDKEEIDTPAEPVHEFRPGIWLAKNDVGYTAYYEFLEGEPFAASCGLEHGIIQGYEYGGSGDELVFTPTSYSAHGGLYHDVLSNSPAETLSPQNSVFPARVEVVSEDEFILHWAHALPETFTFVQDGDIRLEDFPFHCNSALAQLALDYYTAHSDLPSEELAALELGVMTNVDNTVTIQLYKNLGDHNSTAAWYVVDRFTATGTDLTSGEQVDLTLEEEAPIPEQPIEDSQTEGLPGEAEVPETEVLPKDELSGEVYAEN